MHCSERIVKTIFALSKQIIITKISKPIYKKDLLGEEKDI